MFILLLIAGVTLLGGTAALFEKRNMEAKIAQLEAERVQLAAEKVQAIAQLEAKDAQFTAQLATRKVELAVEEAEAEAKRAKAEAKRVEAKAEALEAEVEAKRVELEARAIEVDAYVAETGARYNQFIIEERRVKAWMQRMEKEDVRLEAELVELKKIYGENFPKEVSKNLMKSYFDALKSEDPALLGRMLSNPFGFTEAPKPIQLPQENKNNDLLEQGLQAGAITQDELDDVLCPISHEVMQDPVIGEDKQTYDRGWLRPIYYQLSGTYPQLKLGTYPLTRHAMEKDPGELPRDEACYAKIQSLVQRCQPQPTRPEEAEENPRSSFDMLA